MAGEALLDHVPLPAGNVHHTRCELHPQQAAALYQDELEAVLGTVGRFDLILLGIGTDGHTASLFPGTAALEEQEQSMDFQKPPPSELRTRLTPLQYSVTQENGTERAFQNEYWDNHREGIYVDVVSGKPLFSSLDKFDSGTGWPSFTGLLEPDNIVEREDNSLWASRVEVRSKHADSHLGHVFRDGPLPTGLRYCINSAALRFISKENLAEDGYGKYLELFGGE